MIHFRPLTEHFLALTDHFRSLTDHFQPATDIFRSLTLTFDHLVTTCVHILRAAYPCRHKRGRSGQKKRKIGKKRGRFLVQYRIPITYCCFHVVNLSVRLIWRHFGDSLSFSGFLMLPYAALQHIRSKSVFHARYVWPLVHSTWISCPMGS